MPETCFPIFYSFNYKNLYTFQTTLCPYIIWKSFLLYEKKKKKVDFPPPILLGYNIEDLILGPEQFLEQNISSDFPTFLVIGDSQEFRYQSWI